MPGAVAPAVDHDLGRRLTRGDVLAHRAAAEARLAHAVERRSTVAAVVHEVLLLGHVEGMRTRRARQVRVGLQRGGRREAALVAAAAALFTQVVRAPHDLRLERLPLRQPFALVQVLHARTAWPALLLALRGRLALAVAARVAVARSRARALRGADQGPRPEPVVAQARARAQRDQRQQRTAKQDHAISVPGKRKPASRAAGSRCRAGPGASPSRGARCGRSASADGDLAALGGRSLFVLERDLDAQRALAGRTARGSTSTRRVATLRAPRMPPCRGSEPRSETDAADVVAFGDAGRARHGELLQIGSGARSTRGSPASSKVSTTAIASPPIASRVARVDAEQLRERARVVQSGERIASRLESIAQMRFGKGRQRWQWHRREQPRLPETRAQVLQLFDDLSAALEARSSRRGVARQALSLRLEPCVKHAVDAHERCRGERRHSCDGVRVMSRSAVVACTASIELCNCEHRGFRLAVALLIVSACALLRSAPTAARTQVLRSCFTWPPPP